MKFTDLNLHPQITKALDVCGYNSPTPVQEKSIPVILSGKDLVATAQTGTGKTAAFVLPMLHHLQTIKAQKGKGPRALILTPTRELATQITQAISQYGRFTQPRIVSLVGGMPYHQQIRQLSRPVDIVIATPGRLMDHMESRRVQVSEIEMLVLDEADRMLDMGFIDDVKHIAKTMPAQRQTLLFSATLDSRLTRVVKELLQQPVRIDLCEKITPARITQELYMADNAKHKLRLLLHFLQEQSVYRAIIFSATKKQTDELADTLCDHGLAAGALHGDLRQNVRTRTVDQLRRGKIQFLVATDVAARGIDINDVSHVFNYDLPRFSEDYVHRIGRTGRAGKKGIAISLATSADVRHIKKIEHFTKLPIERKTISGLEPSPSSSRNKQDASPSKHRKKSFGDKKFGDKKFGDKKFGDKKFGDKKFGDKKFGDKKFGDKKFGEKKFGDKKLGDKKFGDKKFGEKKFGDKKFGAKAAKRPFQKSHAGRGRESFA